MPEAVIKDRAFPVVVQFMPLHFKMERTTELCQIKKDNALPAGSILHSQWIKLPHRRSADQTCGHAIFTLSEPEATNKVTTNGLIICQKWVYAEKCNKEPMRCLKCHSWGHLSYDCPQHHDTCGTCTGKHCMPDCTNRQCPHCMSCQMAGHASWDRQCPTSYISAKRWTPIWLRTRCRIFRWTSPGLTYYSPLSFPASMPLWLQTHLGLGSDIKDQHTDS